MASERSVGSRKPGAGLEKKTAALEPQVDRTVVESTLSTTVGAQVLSIAVSTYARHHTTTTTNQTASGSLTSWLARTQAASSAEPINPSAASSPEVNAPGVSSQQAEDQLPPPPESSSPPPDTEEYAQNTIIGYYFISENGDGKKQETELMQLLDLATKDFPRRSRDRLMETFKIATEEYKELKKQYKDAQSGIPQGSVSALELCNVHLKGTLMKYENEMITSFEILIKKWKKASDEDKDELRLETKKVIDNAWDFLNKQVNENQKRAFADQQFALRKEQLAYTKINTTFSFLNFIREIVGLVFGRFPG